MRSILVLPAFELFLRLSLLLVVAVLDFIFSWFFIEHVGGVGPLHLTHSSVNGLGALDRIEDNLADHQPILVHVLWAAELDDIERLVDGPEDLSDKPNSSLVLEADHRPFVQRRYSRLCLNHYARIHHRRDAPELFDRPVNRRDLHGRYRRFNLVLGSQLSFSSMRTIFVSRLLVHLLLDFDLLVLTVRPIAGLFLLCLGFS
mmetsp:Transcript_26691/g.87527  ORF Transcript_26691/g.87527 Transcript_26691/m.87527 type:complete len:202 (+) Transcript_26691:496-1101(+)